MRVLHYLSEVNLAHGGVVRAVLDKLRAAPGFVAVPVSRGKSPDDELEIAVTFRPPPAPKES